MGGRKKERNVVFLIKMDIIPSYTISMKNLEMDTSRKVDSVHLASQSQESSHPEFSHVESS